MVRPTLRSILLIMLRPKSKVPNHTPKHTPNILRSKMRAWPLIGAHPDSLARLRPRHLRQFDAAAAESGVDRAANDSDCGASGVGIERLAVERHVEARIEARVEGLPCATPRHRAILGRPVSIRLRRGPGARRWPAAALCREVKCSRVFAI
jgi:hypothetical protein